MGSQPSAERGRGVERPVVSVVIATYNYADYLPQAVDSALGQSFQDLEVIVVNDGSTDNTAEIVAPYRTHPKVQYFEKPNGGQASAKNLGIVKSRGTYIAFLDADDFWEPHKLDQQLDLFRRNPRVGVVYSGFRLVGPGGEPLSTENPPCYRGRVLRYLYGNNFVDFSSSVVRRDVMERYGMFDESIAMGIDYDLWLRLSGVTEFDYMPKPLVAIRVGHRQMSTNLNGRAYWARKIEARFRMDYPALVTRQMIRDCEMGDRKSVV